VIAKALWSDLTKDPGSTLEATADAILSALLAAPESVRLDLARQLNPWRTIDTASKDETSDENMIQLGWWITETIDDLRSIRDLLINVLVKATGCAEAEVREAPMTCAVKHAAQHAALMEAARALDQALDDMSHDGHCVCENTKRWMRASLSALKAAAVSVLGRSRSRPNLSARHFASLREGPRKASGIDVEG
jgi:hypothetical protein